MNYDTLQDIELVKACLENKRAAQFALYRRFSYSMKGVCLRYSSNESEAEDILQESFIKVFQSLENFKDYGPLGGWIRKITVNTALEFCRKQKVFQMHLAEIQKGQPILGFTPETANDVIERLSAEELLYFIQNMPTGFRTVFNLYAIEGYTHIEIGEMLNISEGTSKSQYSRARLHLQQLIEKTTTQEKALLSINYKSHSL